MSKYFTVKVYGKTRKFRFMKLKYRNNSDALELIEFNGKFEEPWAVLSVNTGTNPPKDHYWIKTWSENEETVEALLKAGYLEKAAETIECGYAEAVAGKLTDKAKPFTESLK